MIFKNLQLVDIKNPVVNNIFSEKRREYHLLVSSSNNH